jgi:multiple sugar transport system permease protein
VAKKFGGAGMSISSVFAKTVTLFWQILFLFFFIFPIVWIFLMSLKQFKDIISYPPRFIFTPTFKNYTETLFGSEGVSLDGKLPEYVGFLMNSAIISGGAVLVATILGVPAAYALARGDFPGKKHIAFTFLSFRFAPELMVILPMFLIYTQIGLYDSYLGMILAHQLICLPLIIWIMMSFFQDFPPEIEEAARVDGASIWFTLRTVVLPISGPGLASATIIAFIFSWNNLIFGLVLAGSNTRPVTMGILQAMTFDQIKWGLMASAAMISAAPGMIAAIYLQRYIVRGLTMGAVK